MAEGLILLVEDEPNDALLIERTLKAAGVSTPAMHLTEGSEAIRYLHGAGRYSDRKQFPLPKLILLDLYLGDIDGFEVLKWVRAQPHLADVRVVVLTASAKIQDANHAYQLGANSFLIKPLEIANAQALLATLAKQRFFEREAA